MTKELDDEYRAAGSFRHSPPWLLRLLPSARPAWRPWCITGRGRGRTRPWLCGAAVPLASSARRTGGRPRAKRRPLARPRARCTAAARAATPRWRTTRRPVGCRVKVTTWPGNPGRTGERPAALTGVVEAWDAASGQHTVRDSGDGSLKRIFLGYCTDVEVLAAAAAPAAEQLAGGGSAAPRRGARRVEAAAAAESPTQPPAHAAPPRARAAGRRVGTAAGAAEAGTVAGGELAGAAAPKPRAKRSAQGGAAKGGAAKGSTKRARPAGEA